jgi:hypothetical protein
MKRRGFGYSLAFLGIVFQVVSCHPSWALQAQLWKAWPTTLRAAYVAGIIDEWDHLSALDGQGAALSLPVEHIASLAACIRGLDLDYVDISYLVEDWMEHHAVGESGMMSDLVRNAFEDLCQEPNLNGFRSQIRFRGRHD